MVYTDDLLAGMEDVPDVKTRAAPGDLSMLSAVAERLAQSSKNQSDAFGAKNQSRESKDILDESRKSKDQSQRPKEHSRRTRSPSSSPERRPRSASSSPERRKTDVLRAKSCLPLSMTFKVPPNCRAGQPVRLQGPHGMLTYPLPQGYQPGDTCTFVLGPKNCMQPLVVPEGKWPGDTITFEGADGKQATAKVPQGLQPGDVFEIMPPVVMVQVPQDALPGDELTFPVPAQANMQDTSDRRTHVPKGLRPFMYFPVSL